MAISRQEYWSGLPSPSPEDLPDPGIEPGSPALQADSLLSEPQGKPSANYCSTMQNLLLSNACSVEKNFCPCIVFSCIVIINSIITLIIYPYRNTYVYNFLFSLHLCRRQISVIETLLMIRNKQGKTRHLKNSELLYIFLEQSCCLYIYAILYATSSARKDLSSSFCLDALLLSRNSQSMCTYLWIIYLIISWYVSFMLPWCPCGQLSWNFCL